MKSSVPVRGRYGKKLSKAVRGTQVETFEILGVSDDLSHDKKTFYVGHNGDPASSASMSGLDPRAVVEIEHLI